MRKKIVGLGANGGVVFLLLLLAVSVHFSKAENVEENDFDDVDDGVVESVQEENFAGSEQMEYESPRYDPKQFHFVDHFDDINESRKRWVQSQAKKDDIAEEIAKYDGLWQWEAPQRIVSKRDIGLVLKSKAKHHAIAAKLQKVFTFKDEKPLVVQYEVTMQEGQDCGGSYLKLLSAGKHTDDLTKFNDKTPYTIMFGPDKCGNDVKMHFIFRHVNPINGSIEEKHAKRPKERLDEPFKDKLPHLYQLIVRPDNTFEMRLDHKIVNEGSLLKDFIPAVNPPAEIDDPNDTKPKDWDEREKIPDPNAQKPEDWDEDAPPQIPDPTAEKPEGWLEDEPEMIPDPTAQKPEDWDSEMDGEWEAPLVDNPVCEGAVGCGKWKAPLIPNKEYKGKWRAPMIDNPNYRGKWAPKKIPNPDFFEDLTPFKMTPISAVGLELWSMSNEILFDNLVITDDEQVAREYAAKTFDVKRQYIDKESDTFFNMVTKYSKENPWPFRIGVVVVATLFAFSFYTLCMKTGAKKAKDTTDSGDAKKTDAVQEDDVSSTAAAAGKGDADDAALRDGSIPKGTKASPKQKKSDLDVADEQTAEQQESEGEGAGEAGIGDETEESTAKPRKRRVRKDQA